MPNISFYYSAPSNYNDGSKQGAVFFSPNDGVYVVKDKNCFQVASRTKWKDNTLSISDVDVTSLTLQRTVDSGEHSTQIQTALLDPMTLRISTAPDNGSSNEYAVDIGLDPDSTDLWYPTITFVGAETSDSDLTSASIQFDGKNIDITVPENLRVNSATIPRHLYHYKVQCTPYMTTNEMYPGRMGYIFFDYYSTQPDLSPAEFIRNNYTNETHGMTGTGYNLKPNYKVYPANGVYCTADYNKRYLVHGIDYTSEYNSTLGTTRWWYSLFCVDAQSTDSYNYDGFKVLSNYTMQWNYEVTQIW